MTMLNDKRLELLVQQEQERISESQPREIDLSIIQARCLCWLVRLAESHEEQTIAAEKSRDTEQAMGWYADAQRVKDVINVITSIEIPNVNDQYSSQIEQEDEEYLGTSETQENDIIYETLEYTDKGLKNGHKRSQVENLQMQKKIDVLSQKSNMIEALIKISNDKLDKINEKLLEAKKALVIFNTKIYSDENVCTQWAEKAYQDLKKKYK